MFDMQFSFHGLLLADWATNIWKDLQTSERFSLLVVLIGCLTGVLCTLIVFTAGVLKSMHQRRLESDMKREMLDRGMSAEEIERVIKSTATGQPVVNQTFVQDHRN